MAKLSLGRSLQDLLWEGKELTTKTVECGACKNQWFVLAASDEFLPTMCCYCGARFTSRYFIGEDA